MLKIENGKLMYYVESTVEGERTHSFSEVMSWTAKPNPWNPKAPKLKLTLNNNLVLNSNDGTDWLTIQKYTDEQRKIKDSGNPYASIVELAPKAYAYADIVGQVTKTVDPVFAVFTKLKQGEVIELSKRGSFSSLCSGKMGERVNFVFDGLSKTSEHVLLRPMNQSNVVGDVCRFGLDELTKYNVYTGNEVDFNLMGKKPVYPKNGKLTVMCDNIEDLW